MFNEFMSQSRKADTKPERKVTPLRLTKGVHDAILDSVGKLHAETGGMLGGDRATGVVTHFHFDTSSRRSGVTYSPDYKLLTKLLTKEWNPNGVQLIGFVHSHPRGCESPSGGDRIYAGDILKANDAIEVLHLPIVISSADSDKPKLLPFIARRGEDGSVEIESVPLVLVDEKSGAASIGRPADETYAEVPEHTVTSEPATPRADVSETFSRVGNAYDLERMARCRIVAVGAGGAAAFLEDLARAGVEEFVLIDPDVVAETNLATQQVYRRDLGRPKVDCIAERLRDINPNARIAARKQFLDDIGDDAFADLAMQPLNGALPPMRTLVCGFTDHFPAQARVNRLALHFALPSLCAQLYREGRGLEVTYTFPGLTPACHRCVLSSRYAAYLDKGFKNDVSSQGTPIFATARLNALKGFIALALLHYDETPAKHPAARRWSELLQRIGDRNLALVRVDPDIATTIGLTQFDAAFGGADGKYLLFDETIWRPQKHECPETGSPHCPDCGGTGDLRHAVGTFRDTRFMPKGGQLL